MPSLGILNRNFWVAWQWLEIARSRPQATRRSSALRCAVPRRAGGGRRVLCRFVVAIRFGAPGACDGWSEEAEFSPWRVMNTHMQAAVRRAIRPGLRPWYPR